MAKCGNNKPGELCDSCIGCEMTEFSFVKHDCDSGCVFCENSGCHSLHNPQANTDGIIKFVHTPKCKDCTPNLEMLKRRSCAGCTKFNYYNK